MEFQNMIDGHQAQIRYYRILSLSLAGVLTIFAVIVPASIKSGHYVIHADGPEYLLLRSSPWNMTAGRLEGFLKVYLTGCFDWTKETFPARKELLQTIVSPPTLLRLKESVTSLELLSK